MSQSTPSQASVGKSAIVSALLEPRPQRRSVRAALRRVRRELDRSRLARRELLAAYRDGLPAERVAAASVRDVGRKMMREHRRQARAIYLGRVGRRIDLVALVSQATREGKPAWTVADPLATAESWWDDGYLRAGDVRGNCVYPAQNAAVKLSRSFGEATLKPTGMPPLPAAVRKLATDRKLRKRAKWVGVLYQPTAWEELRPNPDPALVVEWRDRPGEYFALAVWGHDGPRIMEFVD